MHTSFTTAGKRNCTLDQYVQAHTGKRRVQFRRTPFVSQRIMCLVRHPPLWSCDCDTSTLCVNTPTNCLSTAVTSTATSRNGDMGQHCDMVGRIHTGICRVRLVRCQYCAHHLDPRRHPHVVRSERWVGVHGWSSEPSGESMVWLTPTVHLLHATNVEHKETTPCQTRNRLLYSHAQPCTVIVPSTRMHNQTTCTLRICATTPCGYNHGELP